MWIRSRLAGQGRVMKVSNQWTWNNWKPSKAGGRTCGGRCHKGGEDFRAGERIVRLITDSVQPCGRRPPFAVTFTNAAAAEMREPSAAPEGSPRPATGLQALRTGSWPRWGGPASAPCTPLPGPAASALLPWTWTLSFRVADENETVMPRLGAGGALRAPYAREENSQLYPPLVDSYGGQKDDTVLQELVLEL